VERRRFIKKILEWATSILGGALLAYPAFSFMTFRRVNEKKIVFPRDEQGGRVNFKEGVYLVHESNDMFALSARCPHLGCTLNYDTVSQSFKCPCHGSAFTLAGRRVEGPARKDMARVPLQKLTSGDVEALLRTG